MGLTGKKDTPTKIEYEITSIPSFDNSTLVKMVIVCSVIYACRTVASVSALETDGVVNRTKMTNINSTIPCFVLLEAIFQFPLSCRINTIKTPE